MTGRGRGAGSRANRAYHADAVIRATIPEPAGQRGRRKRRGRRGGPPPLFHRGDYEDDPSWFASVAVTDDGGYEVVRRDTQRREHEVTTSLDRGEIARDLTIWMAART